MHCPERARLTEEYIRAVDDWANLLHAMDLDAGMADVARILAQSAAARAKAKDARKALNEHRTEHGC